jgi:hypothetical protein
MNREFFSHGMLPEAGPLQPPEGPPRLSIVPSRELTQAEKLELIQEMASHAFWREAVMEALPESDSYDWFLSAVVNGVADKEAMEWARAAIVEHIEGVLAERQETWRTYL